MLHNGLHLGIEAVPRLERKNAFAGAVRLVEAGRIVERCHAVEPERDVGARPDKFGAIDQTRLHAGEDLAGDVVWGVAPRRR